jgi:hypothetical protein
VDIMLRHCLALVVGMGLAGQAQAGTWAEGLFTEVNKDFGTVPRGPELSHPFHIRNNTGKPIHISGVRVSCGCVNATPLNTHVGPGQETAVLVKMDTRRFHGPKAVTVYVSFDQPRNEEVHLWVRANSRDDVAVLPDAFSFGHVKRGTTPVSTVTVSFLGSTGWRLEGIYCESNYVRTSMKEIKRDHYETAYQVSAELRTDAPAGKWYTDIWLKTNNPSTPRVRVPLTVEIESLLTVSPAMVDLGQVKVGSSTERKVIVRGVQPFRITDIEGGDDQLTIKDSNDDSRLIHVLAVTLKPTTAGSLQRGLRIRTDLKEVADIEFMTRAQIMP